MSSWRSLVFATFLLQVASALSWRGGLELRKRDAPFVPQMLTIPLRFDSAGRYVTSVAMSTGSGQQQFNFTMSTTTGLTYVAGTQCAGCSGAAMYNQAKSSDAASLSSADAAPLFGQITGASVIKEYCQLSQANGSAWPYPNQTIIVLNEAQSGQVAQFSNAQIGKGLSGLIGLGTNRQTASSSGNSSVYTPQFTDSIYGEWLLQHPTALNFTFGMAINKPLNLPRGNSTGSSSVSSASGSDAGVLHWLQPDSNAYDQSGIVWKDVDSSVSGQLPITSNSSSSGDWFVGLDGWIVVSGSNHITNTQAVVATVDPLYTELYLPQNEARLIHDAIPGSQLRPDLSSIGTLSVAWTVPCNATFSFGLIVGSQTFTIDESSLLIQQTDGTCISAIEGWSDASQTQYLFGARFLSTLYLIFQIPQNGPNTIGFAPRSAPGKSNHVGAIVGGVIGGVAFLVILGFALFFLIYRHRSQTYRITAAQYEGQEIEKPEGTVQPFELQTPTSVQYARRPESTAGSSSGLPTTPVTHALLLHHEEDSDVAPPSYEISEGSGSPTSPVHARPEKPSRSPRNVNASTSSFQQQQAAIPLTTISPPSADGTHGTAGSSTMY